MIRKVEAFARRGVALENDRWSWGGFRSDGTLVLQVWSDDFRKLETGTWAVQIGYPEGDDPSVTEHERLRPGSKERERHIAAIRSGAIQVIELLKGHAIDFTASPRETEGIDADRYGIGGHLVTFNGAAWIECVKWEAFKRWVPR
ncbi:hypothetical protein [Variovorax soli]|nr:hypothetical protein [Variovorax soli]